MWKPEDGVVILILTGDKTRRTFRDRDRNMSVPLAAFTDLWRTDKPLCSLIFS